MSVMNCCQYRKMPRAIENCVEQISVIKTATYWSYFSILSVTTAQPKTIQWFVMIFFQNQYFPNFSCSFIHYRCFLNDTHTFVKQNCAPVCWGSVILQAKYESESIVTQFMLYNVYTFTGAHASHQVGRAVRTRSLEAGIRVGPAWKVGQMGE